jgi:two-component system, LuxR family, sensor kinase FixL
MIGRGRSASGTHAGAGDDEGTVSEIDGQAYALQTIAKAVKIIAVQISLDGVATALLNASLELSGAARGAAVLAAKGALSLGESGFEPGLPLVAKLKPDGELKDLHMDLLRTVLDTRAPIVRAVRPGATVFCTPVVSGDAVKGLLYLEFETIRREATSESAAAITLLASQASMTLDALGDHEPLRNNQARAVKSPSPGNVASFRWNPATRLASGSPEYYRMLGFDQDSGSIDFVSMTSRVHPADYPTAQAVIDDVVRRRAPYRMEFRIVLPSGDVRNLMWSGHFDLADPDSPELVGVVMDVTELRAADDLLRAAHEDADRQLRLAWLGELAGSIVHEVNQPLASIISSADAALRWLERDEPDIEAAVKSVERIGEIARRAGRTVADMRAMTSSTSLEVVERSMNSIVGEALQLSSAMISRSDVRTEIVFDPAKPMVSVNPAQLLQVMLNLVQNAIDSMRDVADRARILGIRTATDAGSVIVEVGDTGVGLPAGNTARLFDPLYTTKKGGMGLGLAICRRVVLMHGGTIDARSNLDFGALFVVSLPRTGSD